MQLTGALFSCRLALCTCIRISYCNSTSGCKSVLALLYILIAIACWLNDFLLLYSITDKDTYRSRYRGGIKPLVDT